MRSVVVSIAVGDRAWGEQGGGGRCWGRGARGVFRPLPISAILFVDKTVNKSALLDGTDPPLEKLLV